MASHSPVLPNSGSVQPAVANVLLRRSRTALFLIAISFLGVASAVGGSSNKRGFPLTRHGQRLPVPAATSMRGLPLRVVAKAVSAPRPVMGAVIFWHARYGAHIGRRLTTLMIDGSANAPACSVYSSSKVIATVEFALATCRPM